MAKPDAAIWDFLGMPPPPPTHETEAYRAWIIARCEEIRRRHMQAAEQEMKPFLDMLACLPPPPITMAAADWLRIADLKGKS